MMTDFDYQLALLTFTPSVILFLYIFLNDKFKEPIDCVIKVFLLGIFLLIPAGILNEMFIFSKGEDYLDYSWIAGITEESLKFAAFYFFITKKFNYNERMDAIVYGALISLGFATVENYEYVYVNFPELDSYWIAGVRALTAVPMHAMCGIIMGYYFGKYHFEHEPINLAKALFIPMLGHAVYNYQYSTEASFIIVLVLFFIARNAHKEFIRFQKIKVTEEEVKRK